MPDTIFQIDSVTKKTVALEPVSFSEIGVRERADLEQWIIQHPSILGEPLLIVSSEFAGFDKSSKRLDILAIDTDGILTIVELKLDAAGSFADLQALRYAAFCSTMTAQQLVAELSLFHGCSIEESQQRIIRFLGKEELPRLSEQPRIILAAGAIEDQELTGCVLWLRKFGIEISCVELTPYRAPGDSKSILLVPRVLIPIPEAKDFMVRVEQKEAADIRATKQATELSRVWAELAKRFNLLAVTSAGLTFQVEQVSRTHFQKIRIPTVPYSQVHYEWTPRRRSGFLDIALHFESTDIEKNEQLVRLVGQCQAEIAKGISEELVIGRFGDSSSATLQKEWREIRFRLPVDDLASDAVVNRAALLMKELVQRTCPILISAKAREVYGD